MGRDKHERRRHKSRRKFVQIWNEVIESPAYRSLSVAGAAALVQICNRYNGGNNGRISFSVREMAERLNVGKDRANRALTELVERRLLIPTRSGWFSNKHRQATEWRIPFQPTDQAPTNDHRNWKPGEIQNTVPKRGTHGPEGRDTTRTAQRADGPQEWDTTDHATVPKRGTHVHCSHIPSDLKGASAAADSCDAAMAAMTEINLPIGGLTH